jgi:hypothetical protein
MKEDKRFYYQKGQKNKKAKSDCLNGLALQKGPDEMPTK